MTYLAKDWTDFLGHDFDSPDQAPMTKWVSQRAGAILAAVAFRVGITPNFVTIAGALVMGAACLSYVSSNAVCWVIAAILWQLGFALDCADGQLARGTGRTSEYGAWLDVACDHARQVAISFSVLYVLLTEGMPLPVSIICCLFLQSGASVYLHTAATMKIKAPPVIILSRGASYLRWALRVILDTPVFLLLICIFRTLPWLLGIFVAIIGLLLVIRGISISRLRLENQLLA